MSDNFDYDKDDLALYAMQLLSEEDAAPLRSRLERSPELRRELGEVEGDLAVYALSSEMHSPPALARERLIKQIAREKKVQAINRSQEYGVASSGVRSAEPIGAVGADDDLRPVRRIDDEEEEPVRRGGMGRVLPWIGWAVAAGLAVATVNLFQQRDALRQTVVADRGQVARLSVEAASAREVLDLMNDPTAVRVSITKPHTTPIPEGKATYAARTGTLFFTASNMEPLPPEKTYELWIIPADGRAPVAAGLFRPDEHGFATVVLPPLPKGVPAKAFGITVENEGGSATPTMPIVMAGS